MYGLIIQVYRKCCTTILKGLFNLKLFLYVLVPSPFSVSSEPHSLSGVTCAVASTAAVCHHISPPLCISSACSVLLPRRTTVCPRPATATRWWFAVAGNQGLDWDQKERGLNSQCQLCWKETRQDWGLDRWKKPKLLTSKPEIATLWNHHPRIKTRG